MGRMRTPANTHRPTPTSWHADQEQPESSASSRLCFFRAKIVFIAASLCCGAGTGSGTRSRSTCFLHQEGLGPQLVTSNLQQSPAVFPVVLNCSASTFCLLPASPSPPLLCHLPAPFTSPSAEILLLCNCLVGGFWVGVKGM